MGAGWRSELGVVIGVGLRDRRWVWDVEITVEHGDRCWAWDVEIAVGHRFPVFGSNLGGDDGMGLGDSGDGRIWIWAWVSGVWLSFC